MSQTNQYLTVHILPDENISDVTIEGYKKLYALKNAANKYLNATTSYEIRKSKELLKSRIEEADELIISHVTLNK